MRLTTRLYGMLEGLCKRTGRVCGQQSAKVLFVKSSTFYQFANVFRCKSSDYSIGKVSVGVITLTNQLDCKL